MSDLDDELEAELAGLAVASKPKLKKKATAKKKAVKKPAPPPPVDDLEDELEEEEIAPKPKLKKKAATKKKAASKPAPIDDDDDDELEEPKPVIKKKKKGAAKKPPPPADDDEDNDHDDDVPRAKPKPKPKKESAEMLEKKKQLAAMAKMLEEPTVDREMLEMERKKKAELDKMKAELAEIQTITRLKAARRDKAIDMCFLLDATGSMGPFIDAAKEQIISIVDAVKRTFPDVVLFRTACVAYRDYGDKQQFEWSDFSLEPTTTKTFLAGLKPTGGGDIPEDLYGGLYKMKELSWKARTCVCIIITDAPCHGDDFHHRSIVDNHTTPDDTDNMRSVLKLLRTMGIRLFMGHIEDITTQMEKKIAELYNEGEYSLIVNPLSDKPEAFLKFVVQSVTVSVQAEKKKSDNY